MNESSAELLRKARRTVRSAEVLVADGDPESAASRAYYAMFYVAKALLEAKGVVPRKHSGVQHAIWEHFIKPGLLDNRYHRWLIDAFDQRLQSDYGYASVVGGEDVIETLAQAREFLAAAEELLA